MRPKTTLILGAGASCPYGFPTASELREILVQKNPTRVKEILDRLNAPSRLGDIVMRSLLTRFPDKIIQRFQNEFFWSQTGSIDEFAQERGDVFTKVARVALATIFLQCESSAYLDGNWYRAFRRWLLSKGPGSIPYDRVQIITFNYDRSLEYYLWKAIQYTYDLPEGDAFDVAGHLLVHHVYGSLGRLRGSTATTDAVTWASTEDRFVDPAAESLHLVRPTSIGLPTEVADFLTHSEFVCFLGFGFWPENFRLVERHVGPAAQVFASNMGLAPVLAGKIQSRFPKIVWGEGWTVDDCMQGWNLFPES